MISNNTIAIEALEGFLNGGSSLGASHPHFASYFSFSDDQWAKARAALSALRGKQEPGALSELVKAGTRLMERAKKVAGDIKDAQLDDLAEDFLTALSKGPQDHPPTPGELTYVMSRDYEALWNIVCQMKYAIGRVPDEARGYIAVYIDVANGWVSRCKTLDEFKSECQRLNLEYVALSMGEAQQDGTGH